MCFCKKKTIAPKLNITNKELVVVQKLPRKGIKVGTKLIVPRNFAFVVLKNDKILDILQTGEHILDAQTLPKAIRRLNLYNKSKKLKYIPVNACFVNLNDFDEVLWQTTKKVELEDKKYGVFKVGASGQYNFKITNEEKFLEYIFSNLTELSNEGVANVFLDTVNKTAEKTIYSKNYGAEMLYYKDKQIVKDIFATLSDNLHKAGVTFSEITLENIEFPNKILKELEKLPELKESNIAETSAFENWQKQNPNPEKKGIQFVTIEPAKKGSKNFFKESMPPYFFNEEPEEEQPEPKRKNKWLGPIEQEKIEKSKAYVNLDDVDSNN